MYFIRCANTGRKYSVYNSFIHPSIHSFRQSYALKRMLLCDDGDDGDDDDGDDDGGVPRSRVAGKWSW